MCCTSCLRSNMLLGIFLQVKRSLMQFIRHFSCFTFAQWLLRMFLKVLLKFEQPQVEYLVRISIRLRVNEARGVSCGTHFQRLPVWSDLKYFNSRNTETINDFQPYYYYELFFRGSEFLTEYSEHCGFILLFSYELSVQIHLVISLNRFFAVWTPYRYKTMFSERNTKIIIFLIFILTLGFSFSFYEGLLKRLIVKLKNQCLQCCALWNII